MKAGIIPANNFLSTSVYPSLQLFQHPYAPAHQQNPHTTATFPSAAPNTAHGYKFHEWCSYRHEQAVIQSKRCCSLIREEKNSAHRVAKALSSGWLF